MSAEQKSNKDKEKQKKANNASQTASAERYEELTFFSVGSARYS